MFLDRPRIADALAGRLAVDSPVTLRGWVRTRRDSKAGFSFIHLHDGSCFEPIQVLAESTLGNYEDEVRRLTTGCSIEVDGTLIASAGGKQAVEVKAASIRVLGWVDDPETYPMQPKPHSMEFLREQAHLRARTNLIGAVTRVRNALAQATHRFFHSHGFYWVHTPIITASDCEGAGEMFRVSTIDPANPPKTADGKVDYAQDFFGKPAVDHPPRAVGHAPQPPTARFGLHKSRGVVAKLSALFALDAFAGGFIIDSLAALWLVRRFEADPLVIGTVFFWTNLLGGLSGLAAAKLARRFGLVNTMVFTHLPSNVLLILVPLMPNLWSAAAMLFARSCISQMDVPTRQAYTMAVVEPDERSAASGVTTVARSLGASLSPLLVGPMLANPALLGLPFFLAGGIKIVYDLLLYRQFVKVPER